MWWYHQAFVVALAKYGGGVARRLSGLLTKAAEGDISFNSLSEVIIPCHVSGHSEMEG